MTVDPLKTSRLPLLAGFAMALFALLIQLSSPVGSQPPHFLWLFAPGLVGWVGASFAPAPVRLIAALLAIAAFWSMACHLLLIALRRARRR